jgi:hypothetical protein
MQEHVEDSVAGGGFAFALGASSASADRLPTLCRGNNPEVVLSSRGAADRGYRGLACAPFSGTATNFCPNFCPPHPI